MHIIPKKVFFTKGVGYGTEELMSFESALRKAGIQTCNLVHVSSIFAPYAQQVTPEEGLKLINPGEITYCVMARVSTNEANRLVAASIGCAMPKDKGTYGYLSECHSNGETASEAGEKAEDLAATMLATTLGIEFDSNTAWVEREQEYKASGQIFKTFNVTQSAEGKRGNWTTVVAVAVFAEVEVDPFEKTLTELQDKSAKMQHQIDELSKLIKK